MEIASPFSKECFTRFANLTPIFIVQDDREAVRPPFAGEQTAFSVLHGTGWRSMDFAGEYRVADELAVLCIENKRCPGVEIAR